MPIALGVTGVALFHRLLVLFTCRARHGRHPREPRPRVEFAIAHAALRRLQRRRRGLQRELVLRLLHDHVLRLTASLRFLRARAACGASFQASPAWR